jgi:hypothetical protein
VRHQLGVVNGEDRAIVVAVAGVDVRARGSERVSSTSARWGTSVPVSQTPSHTSPSGPWSRQSLCQTTGRPVRSVSLAAVIARRAVAGLARLFAVRDDHLWRA